VRSQGFGKKPDAKKSPQCKPESARFQGFRRGVLEACTLLRCYTAYAGHTNTNIRYLMSHTGEGLTWEFNIIVVIGNIHPIIGQECLEGENKYSSTLSLTSALDRGGLSTPHPGRFNLGKETRKPL